MRGRLLRVDSGFQFGDGLVIKDVVIRAIDLRFRGVASSVAQYLFTVLEKLGELGRIEATFENSFPNLLPGDAVPLGPLIRRAVRVCWIAIGQVVFL